VNGDQQATDLLDALLTPPSMEGRREPARPGDSLRGHLERLLNSRQGTLTHQPDYGLPDLSDVYLNVPHSLERLAFEVKRCIQAHEPRLRQVRIHCQLSGTSDSVIDMTIEGRIGAGERFALATRFLRDGRTVIVG